jgi:hypothetical protein
LPWWLTATTNFAINIDGMAQNATTPEILHLSQPSRQGDKTKFSSGMSWSWRGVNLIETLQYMHPKHNQRARAIFYLLMLLLLSLMMTTTIPHLHHIE